MCLQMKGRDHFEHRVRVSRDVGDDDRGADVIVHENRNEPATAAAGFRVTELDPVTESNLSPSRERFVAREPYVQRPRIRIETDRATNGLTKPVESNEVRAVTDTRCDDANELVVDARSVTRHAHTTPVASSA
jgi:hypothetical protein